MSRGPDRPRGWLSSAICRDRMRDGPNPDRRIATPSTGHANFVARGSCALYWHLCLEEVGAVGSSLPRGMPIAVLERCTSGRVYVLASPEHLDARAFDVFNRCAVRRPHARTHHRTAHRPVGGQSRGDAVVHERPAARRHSSAPWRERRGARIGRDRTVLGCPPPSCSAWAACCPDEFTGGGPSYSRHSSDWRKRDGDRLPTLRVLPRQLS